MRKGILAALLVAALILAGCGSARQQDGNGQPVDGDQNGAATVKQWDSPPEMQIDPKKQYFATLETSLGTMRIELFAADAPKTVNNFVFLAREGFYDGVKFHRIIKDFMVQTGDPEGTGRGGPGYRFEDELPPKRSYTRGIVAMANSGPNTNGSQFFICHGENCGDLDRLPNYTQFGMVVEGLDVLDKLASVEVYADPESFDPVPSRPVDPPTITRVTIEEVGGNEEAAEADEAEPAAQVNAAPKAGDAGETRVNGVETEEAEADAVEAGQAEAEPVEADEAEAEATDAEEADADKAEAGDAQAGEGEAEQAGKE